MERKGITPFSIDIKKEHLSKIMFEWYEQYLTPENCEIVSFKFSISTQHHKGLYFSPMSNGDLRIVLRWKNEKNHFYSYAYFSNFIDFSTKEISLSHSFSTLKENCNYNYFFNDAFCRIIEKELDQIKEKVNQDFPELRRILDEELDKKLKVGDYVKVSGTLTGHGDLKGYITDIGKFVTVKYDSESSIIANGEKGKVGLPHFFTKDNNQPK